VTRIAARSWRVYGSPYGQAAVLGAFQFDRVGTCFGLAAFKQVEPPAVPGAHQIPVLLHPTLNQIADLVRAEPIHRIPAPASLDDDPFGSRFEIEQARAAGGRQDHRGAWSQVTCQPDLAASTQARSGWPSRSGVGTVITATSKPARHDQAVPKEGRALRTETTINDTRDFGIGKRLTNLAALREVGFSASRRLLRLERLSHDPITGAEAITAVTGPVLTGAGTRIPGLPLAQARSHALLAALLIFRLLPRGFTNRDLREVTAELRGLPTVTAGQITYDLRRLRSHQLIERVPRTHRYRVTGTGLHTAMILTRIHDRVLPAGLAHLTQTTGPPSKLRVAATAYQTAIDNIIHDAGLAAGPPTRHHQPI